MSEIKGEKFIHFHIPKTAGTSLRATFVEHFGAEQVGYLRSDGQIVRVSDIPLGVERVDRIRSTARKAGLMGLYARAVNLVHRNSASPTIELSSMSFRDISVAIGHFTAAHITQDVSHIPRTTVVRHPLERAWSHYNHWRDSRGQHAGIMDYSSKTSFEDFASHPDMTNFQTAQLGGLGFSVIGVSGNIPGFLEEIGLNPDMYLPSLNPGRHRELPTMDPGFLRDFEEANRADYELFASAGGQ